MSTFTFGPPTARPTRFPGLGYRMDAPGLWRIVDTDGNAAIGPHYSTKMELLADLHRFAGERGFT